MIEQFAGDAQDEAWDAITEAAADAGDGSKPLSLSNVVLLATRNPLSKQALHQCLPTPPADSR